MDPTQLKILIALIPLLPFVGFLVVGALRNRLPEKVLGALGCTGPFLSFIASVLVVKELYYGEAARLISDVYHWMTLGALDIKISFVVDPLSGLLCLIITGVGSLIHFYSIGYMHDDEGFGRYFSYLNLFTAMMLVLVLGESLPLMFVGWEGVGLCSYLLIGFWYSDMKKSEAAQKAFIVNRVGDAAFLVGIFLTFFTFETLSFQAINAQVPGLVESQGWILAAIGILLFIGATGKSAQIPLYTWLPDAMAGPTPVSALIHAATMVTAGVYMVGRLSPLFGSAPYVSEIVAAVGALTALFAALMAITQRDIKKILAYSTVSQLGYMFLAMGLGAYTFGIFHLTTHAFFKALLFLGAGAVIHSYMTKKHPHGIQDAYEMGGLWKRLPIGFLAFAAGGLSLAALPPFSGFFSKDPILAYALTQAKSAPLAAILWAVGLVTAFLTVAYTFRLIALVFFGEPRGDVVYEKNPHPSFTMATALVVLSIFSVFGGGLEHFMEEFLAPVWGPAGEIHISHSAHMINLALAATGSILVALVVFFLFHKKLKVVRQAVNRNPVLWFAYFLSFRKFFVDEIYNALFVVPLKKGSKALLKWVDLFIIEGIVNGIPKVCREMGWILRQLQSGRVNTYATFILLGTLAGLGYVGYLLVFIVK